MPRVRLINFMCQKFWEAALVSNKITKPPVLCTLRCALVFCAKVSNKQASFPHDVEIIASKNQPPCASHNFVIQQDSSHTLYGVSLRVWSRADDKRKETINELRKRVESGFSSYSVDTEEYWIPYSYGVWRTFLTLACVSFLVIHCSISSPIISKLCGLYILFTLN